MIRRLRLALAASVLALGAVACGPTGPQPQVRLFTDDYSIAISFEPAPPCALEQVEFKVVVRDAKTGEPIEHGDGRIAEQPGVGAGTRHHRCIGGEQARYAGRDGHRPQG